MDENDLKIIEIRVKNLMLSKQLIVQTLTVIIGGIIGLWFTPSIFKWPLTIFGLMFSIVLIKNFQDINTEINGYLYGKRRK